MGNLSIPTLVLPDHLKRALAAGHPWVYRDHVPRSFRARTGDWIEIHAGNWRGFALWDDESPIALRVFSLHAPPDAAWIRDRVLAAWRLRQPLRETATTAYRWINGEGDGLPGTTVDLYGRFAVLVTYTPALENMVPWICEALSSAAPLDGVVRRRRSERAGEDGSLETVWGAAPSRELIVEENGIKLLANLFEGQKTGLFLDHRENRLTVRGMSRARNVLNLFAYTGAFSVSAALGGASHVTSVDVAPAAIEAAGRNMQLNGVDPAVHDAVAADVFEYLERVNSQARRFDLVICDPPSFAKSKEQAEQACRAYARLFAMSLRVTAPGGLLAAASCTSQVGPETFKEVLADAGRQSKRRLQIIHEAGQAMDHPVFAQHREGRYLKFVVARALAPA